MGTRKGGGSTSRSNGRRSKGKPNGLAQYQERLKAQRQPAPVAPNAGRQANGARQGTTSQIGRATIGTQQ